MKALYNIYYLMGQMFVTVLSFFLFKKKTAFISNFIKLLRHKSEILVTLNIGPKFYVRSFNDLMVIRQVFSDKVYKSLFTDLKEEATFLDIGAYIGDSVIYASRYAKIKKIIAVEPVPDNLKFLRKNLKENEIANVVVYEKAIAPDSKGRNIYIFPDETRASFTNSHGSCGKVFVPTVTLNELVALAKTKLVLMKCDIEGGEYELILRSSLETLSRINRIMIELHLINLKDKKILSKVLSHLEKSGFICKIKKSFFNPNYPLLYGFRQ